MMGEKDYSRHTVHHKFVRSSHCGSFLEKTTIYFIFFLFQEITFFFEIN